MAALHHVSDEMTITTWDAGDWLVIVTRDIQMVILKQAETDGKWINKAQNRQEYRAFKTKSVAQRRYNALIREFGELRLLEIDWEAIAQNLSERHAVIVKREGIFLDITSVADDGHIVDDVKTPIGRSEKPAENWLVNWLWYDEDPCVVFVKDHINNHTRAGLYLGTAEQQFGEAGTALEAFEKAFNGL